MHIAVRSLFLTAFVAGVLAAFVPAQGFCEDTDQAAELAKKLANPIASLISVPLQFNYDEKYGINDDAEKYFINVQPVIPISLSDDWNLISRTILPVIDQSGIVPGEAGQSGIGNITQSFFLSPKAPGPGGLIWGAGPVIVIPTAADGLGPDQWALGVTGVGLRVTGPLTLGVLANHVWSVGGASTDPDISQTFLQPFASYTTANATSFGLNTEATYDWTTDQWTVPINATVSQLVRVFGQPVSLVAGVRYWANAPANGPEDWGLRAGIVYVFPK
jgi:hypothetical protein